MPSCQELIMQCLKVFVNSPNLKPLCSARNKSPTQLWIEGLLQIYHSSHPVAQELSGQLDFMTGVSAMITVILFYCSRDEARYFYSTLPMMIVI